jgi:hypothetical protein
LSTLFLSFPASQLKPIILFRSIMPVYYQHIQIVCNLLPLASALNNGFLQHSFGSFICFQFTILTNILRCSRFGGGPNRGTDNTGVHCRSYVISFSGTSSHQSSIGATEMVRLIGSLIVCLANVKFRARILADFATSTSGAYSVS